jgi:hypothetical protein
VKEFEGSLNEALMLENMKIRNYLGQTSVLPNVSLGAYTKA